MPLDHSDRNAYKPFEYPWAYNAWLAQRRVVWQHDEVPLKDDVADWHGKLRESERHLVTQIFRFFTQSDVEVQNCYNSIYAAIFKPTEIKMMLGEFSATENVHIAAYSHLLDTIGMPEAEYSAFLGYKEMKDKFDYMRSFDTGEPLKDAQRIAETLAVFGAFTEGLQLFASFAILLNFQRFNKLKGMGQVVAYSTRDETIHALSVIRLFHTWVDEHPSIDRLALDTALYAACRLIVSHEDVFIDLAFEAGDVEGLTAAEIKEYIRFMADLRLQQLGLEPIFHVAENPLPWMDEVLNGVEFAAFFEAKSTEYTKGATRGDWSEADVWDDSTNHVEVPALVDA